MKPKDVTNDSFAEYNEVSNEKDPKFKVSYHVRTSKYKNTFAKGYTPNWSEEIFIVKKIKNTLPWTYVISDFNNEEIVGSFYEKELQKTNKKEFRIEKVIKKKVINYMSNGKNMITLLTVGLIKKMIQYFPTYAVSKNNVKVILNLNGYAKEDDLEYL